MNYVIAVLSVLMLGSQMYLAKTAVDWRCLMRHSWLLVSILLGSIGCALAISMHVEASLACTLASGLIYRFLSQLDAQHDRSRSDDRGDSAGAPARASNAENINNRQDRDLRDRGHRVSAIR